MEQTAVEWLEEHVIIGLTYDQQLLFEATFEKAKEMERGQLYKFYIQGGVDLIMEVDRNVEDFYNETFKSE